MNSLKVLTLTLVVGLLIPMGTLSAGHALYAKLLGHDDQVILEGRLTSTMGYTGKTPNGDTQLHKGIDIAAPAGTPIYAPANGIAYVRSSPGYGIVLALTAGDTKTIFAHLQSVEVADGEQVKRGDLIARVGATGKTDKPHAHIETFVRGERVNPVEVWRLEKGRVGGI